MRRVRHLTYSCVSFSEKGGEDDTTVVMGVGTLRCERVSSGQRMAVSGVIIYVIFEFVVFRVGFPSFWVVTNAS